MRSKIVGKWFVHSHSTTKGYTLAEIALTMPAALIVILACIASLHLSAKLLRDCSEPFATRTLAMLHLRRDLSSCIVTPAETTDGFEFYDRWGRKRSLRQLVRETASFAVLSIDIDTRDVGPETQPTQGVVAFVRCDVRGKAEELRIATRLASESEAEFLEEYGQNPLP